MLCWGCSSRGASGSVSKSAGPKRCGRMSASPYDCLLLPKKKRMLSCNNTPTDSQHAITVTVTFTQHKRDNFLQLMFATCGLQNTRVWPKFAFCTHAFACEGPSLHVMLQCAQLQFKICDVNNMQHFSQTTLEPVYQASCSA